MDEPKKIKDKGMASEGTPPTDEILVFITGW